MNKKLAILGTRGVPARYGGFETFAEEIAIRLKEQGVAVTVYCEKNPSQPEPVQYRGINLVYIPSPPCGPLTTVLFDMLCLWHARKGYDVVYMLGYGAAPFCFIPRMWGSRVWLNVDGIEWARAKWSSLAKLYFKLMETFSLWTPTRVIADAQAVHDHLRRRHSGHKPISVIPYGAAIIGTPPDPAILSEWSLTANSYYLIVCRLEPENHVREILEGFAASASTRQLIVVGNHRSGSPYVDELLGICDPRIRFIGTVFDKEKLEALRFHVFVYCHGHSVGGTNPTLLEALGCANAVLAHDNPFNREVAGDAACYFKDAAGITQIISDLETDMNTIRRMRKLGPNIISERYTWSRITKSYLDLMRKDISQQY